MTVRVGVVGHGGIGAELAARIAAAPGIELAFIAVRDAARHPEVDDALLLGDVGRLAERSPDLVVEAADGDVTRVHGETILTCADYLPLSATALADDALRSRLLARAAAAGTRLLLPAGALVGAQALAAIGGAWASVRITMEKPPGGIADVDAAASHSTDRQGRTVLHDGTVRDAARRFPRNVNAMVVAALVTLGLDRTRAVLVADPARTDARLLVEATGHDGSELRVERRQPLSGVSGTEMGASAWASVLAATGAAPSLSVV